MLKSSVHNEDKTLFNIEAAIIRNILVRFNLGLSVKT